MSTIQSYKYSEKFLNHPQLNQEDKLCLNQVIQSLIEDGFGKISPIRLSYTYVIQHNQQKKQYQGLIKAEHRGENEVEDGGDVLIIKWQSHNHAHILQEISMLQQLYKSTDKVVVPRIIKTGNIVTLNNHIASQHSKIGFDYYAMQFYPLGDIKKFLMKVSKKYPVEDLIEIKKKLIRAVAETITELHSINVKNGSPWIHGDIKPSNILVTDFNKQKDNWNIEVKLIDFPMNDTLNKSESIIGGTPAYLAPECWDGQKKMVSSDCYAFGIMMYEILMEQKPFSLNQQQKNVSHQQQLACWKQKHQLLKTPKLSNEFSEYQAALNHCLAKNLSQRTKGITQLVLNIL